MMAPEGSELKSERRESTDNSGACGCEMEESNGAIIVSGRIKWNRLNRSVLESQWEGVQRGGEQQGPEKVRGHGIQAWETDPRRKESPLPNSKGMAKMGAKARMGCCHQDEGAPAS